MESRLLSLTNLRAQVRNQLLETYEVIYARGITNNEDALAKERQLVLQRMKEVSKNFPDNPEVLKSMISKYEEVDQGLNRAIAFAKKNDVNGTKKAIIQTRQVKFNEGFILFITDFIETQQLTTKEASVNLASSVQRLQSMQLAFGLIAIILTGLLSFILSKSIGGRLVNLERATKKVSNGDFDISIPEHGTDELSMLSKAFNSMALSLKDARGTLQKQQELITYSSKMSALGEMAGGIAHEINNPLAIIAMRVEQLEECINDGDATPEILANGLSTIKKTVDRIAKIVSGLKFFAREGQNAPMQPIAVSTLILETLGFCQERFKHHGVMLELIENEIFKTAQIECRSVEISQVLLNLLNNSYDAIENLESKWIRVELAETLEKIHISVTDSGSGIPKEVREKMMQPFYTTKEIGKGTGLGLSISKGILEEHGGQIIYDENSANTKLTIVIPKKLKN